MPILFRDIDASRNYGGVTMGRPPIGKKAMTDVERQEKRRARLKRDEWSPEGEAGALLDRLRDMEMGRGDYMDVIGAMLNEIGRTEIRAAEIVKWKGDKGEEKSAIVTTTVTTKDEDVTLRSCAAAIATQI